jgi:putative FmdB family regulatory protein
MPIYEYRCGQCRAEFELLVRGNDSPQCPQCESEKLERKLSVVAAPVASSAGGGAPEPGGMCGRPQCGSFGCQGLG